MNRCHRSSHEEWQVNKRANAHGEMPETDASSAQEERPDIALTDGPDPLIVNVVDLRQWHMCGRIVYYQYILGTFRPVTYSMQAGMEAHVETSRRERRRTLRVYGIPDGQRHFDVRLFAPEMGLSGLVDLVIEREKELIPVDFKDSHRVNARHFAVQVAAYGLLLEHLWGRSVQRGFVYSIPRRRVHEVRLTSSLRRTVQQTIEAIRQALLTSRLPPPPSSQRLCVTCEFRRFCNDVF